MAALPAGPELLVGIELLDDRLELLPEIHELEVGIVEDLAALLAEPAEVVALGFGAPALDHQAHRVRGPLGRMGDPGREEEHLALADRDLAELPVLDHPE